MTVAAKRLSTHIAGFPLSAWAFAGRTWLALVLALYIAFWLQLESPATSALTVAVLAFPWRGQGLEKAVYRVFATLIGLTAAIVIIGTFNQTGWLLIAVLAGWVGICVYASSLFDGFRSYAAVLCIITVCLVAIEPLDTPQNVFDLAHERGAAILIGILSTTFINDILFAPDYFPAIGERLRAMHRKVTAYAALALRAEENSAEAAAVLIQEITALRPEITSLVTETSIGPGRSAAARTAMVDLVLQLEVARGIAALRNFVQRFDWGTNSSASSVGRIGLDWMQSELCRRERNVAESLAALSEGLPLERAHKAPFYRSHRIAGENGIRAVIYFVLAAIALANAGWPSTSVSLAFVGILIGLSSMSPNQNAATLLALVAVPVGCILAGTLEFLVLDGVTAFPLLAIGLLPFTIVPALIMTIPNPALISLGRACLVFTLAIFAPSNPQTYDPQTFLFSCAFLSTAAILIFFCQRLLPPLPMKTRAEILLSESRQAAARPLPSKCLDPDDELFRQAVLVGQIVRASEKDPAKSRVIEAAVACFDCIAARQLAADAIKMLPHDAPEELRQPALAAVVDNDGAAMMTVAIQIFEFETLNSNWKEAAIASFAVAASVLQSATADPEVSK